MYKNLLAGLLALSAFLPLPFTAGPAHAQQSTIMPRIDGFDVQPILKPTPGSELNFTLYGSAGGVAAVQIGGATAGVGLAETEAGVYEGTYTIRLRDKISNTSSTTANLRLGNNVATTILDEPLIGKPTSKRVYNGSSAANAPTIDRFDVDPPQQLKAGEELILMLTGTPGGAASARIAGVRGKLLLREIRSGVYEGAHIIKKRDRIAANSVVTGNLRIGSRETTKVLGQSLLSSAGYRASSRQTARLCVNCGVVEAINLVEVKGEGSYLGMIAGGVAGALLGSQVGGGSGRTAAGVVGAAGGAYAGNEIEKRMKTTNHYEVLVRLDNGGAQTISYPTLPGFAVGTKVQVEDGTLTVRQ